MDSDIILYIFQLGANDLNSGLYGVCEKGHVDIIEYLINSGGNKDIACFMIRQGATECS
jgi:hypothetical protein